MQDENGWVDESYFTPPCPAALRQPREKKPKQDEPVPRSLNAKRKRLDQIAADPNTPYSDRQDARRILQLADIRPAEFSRDFAELMSRLPKEQPMSNPFRSVLELGYDHTQAGKHSAVYVLMCLAAQVFDDDPNNPAIEPGGTPKDCPMQEVLRRLSYFADTDFIKQLAQDLPVVH